MKMKKRNMMIFLYNLFNTKTMNAEEIKETCRAAIRTFGTRSQVKKAVEEMGELETALMRFPDRANADDVVTEIADVMITAAQLALMFGYDRVQDEVVRKIIRLQGRIKSEEYYQKQMKEYYGN